jgi:hypothetical protein
MTVSKALFGMNILSAIALMFLAPSPALGFSERNCCRTDTSGESFCCVDCCWGEIDACDKEEDCQKN